MAVSAHPALVNLFCLSIVVCLYIATRIGYSRLDGEVENQNTIDAEFFLAVVAELVVGGYFGIQFVRYLLT